MPQRSLSSYLEEAYELVKAHGIRGTMARDCQGNRVDPQDTTACEWCSVGAIHKVYPPDVSLLKGYGTLPQALGTLNLAAKALNGRSSVFINDEAPELLHQMWEWAIAYAKKGEARG